MLRGLFITFKFILLLAALFWATQQPGTIEISWMDYNIKAQVGLVLFCALMAMLVILFFHRLYIYLSSLPKVVQRRNQKNKLLKGWRFITKGLGAVAAGDGDSAAKMAKESRQLLPDDKGLSILLEAQAARLKGDEKAAAAHFQTLLENKDTAFLGVRGLLVGALEKDEHERALELARKGLDMHPRQRWIIMMVYDLEIKRRLWDDALKTLRRALRYGAVDEGRAARDEMAMMMAQAEDAVQKGDQRLGLKYAQKALKSMPDFAPATVMAAQLYMALGKRRSAVKSIEAVWKKAPHPDLLGVWKDLEPENKTTDSLKAMRWYEKLVSLCPDSDLSQIAAAEAAIKYGLWREAREYLEAAEKLRESAQLYRLFAKLYEKTGEDERAAEYQEKAWNADPDPVWVCNVTGRLYKNWQPIAPPHNSFNTIIWGYPQAGGTAISALAAAHQGESDLRLSPPQDLLAAP